MREPLPIRAHLLLDDLRNGLLPGAGFFAVNVELVFILFEDDQVFQAEPLDEIVLVYDDRALLSDCVGRSAFDGKFAVDVAAWGFLFGLRFCFLQPWQIETLGPGDMREFNLDRAVSVVGIEAT